MSEDVLFRARVKLRHGPQGMGGSPGASSLPSSSDRGSSTSASSASSTAIISSSSAKRSTASTNTLSSYLDTGQPRPLTPATRGDKKIEDQGKRDVRQQDHQPHKQWSHSPQVECPTCGSVFDPEDHTVVQQNQRSRHLDILPSRTPSRSTTPTSTSSSAALSTASASLQRLTPMTRPTSAATSRTSTPVTSRTSSPSIASRPASRSRSRHSKPSPPLTDQTLAVRQPLPSTPASAQPLNFLVVGGTGAGKSLFVDVLCSSQYPPDSRQGQRGRPKIGNTLSSCTSTVTPYPCVHTPTSTQYNLIDTPGFDDTVLSDAEHLTSLSTFLTALYSSPSSQVIHGIIFLTRIIDMRLSASHLKTAQIIRRICGDLWKGRYALVSSMWDLIAINAVEFDNAVRNEEEMCKHPQFWGGLDTERNGKAMSFRFRGSHQSAQSVIDWFLSPRNSRWLRKSPPLVLPSQLSAGKLLSETDAGIYVLGELSKQRAKHVEAVKRLRKEIEDAKLDGDGKAVEAYKEMRLREVGRLKKGEGVLRKMMGMTTREVMVGA